MSTKKKEELKTNIENTELSPKEIYDQKKQEKEKQKIKPKSKKNNKNKKKKTYTTNLGGKIFAIIMLLLMVASIFGYAISYFQ